MRKALLFLCFLMIGSINALQIDSSYSKKLSFRRYNDGTTYINMRMIFYMIPWRYICYEFKSIRCGYTGRIIYCKKTIEACDLEDPEYNDDPNKSTLA